MTPCEGCAATLTAIQVYRGNRFCSVRCSNARGFPHSRGNAVRWSGQRRWQHVLGLLNDTWMTLSDLAIWAYGDDTPAHMTRVRQALYEVRRRGYPLESRSIPWPTPERQSVRGYRLAQVRKEHAA